MGLGEAICSGSEKGQCQLDCTTRRCLVRSAYMSCSKMMRMIGLLRERLVWQSQTLVPIGHVLMRLKSVPSMYLGSSWIMVYAREGLLWQGIL